MNERAKNFIFMRILFTYKYLKTNAMNDFKEII